MLQAGVWALTTPMVMNVADTVNNRIKAIVVVFVAKLLDIFKFLLSMFFADEDEC
jgi:hypothetical protein